ncbi:MAG: cobyric acid synthase, partial [Acidimicrobiales bacterium]
PAHGIFEDDLFRNAWLKEIAGQANSSWTQGWPPVSFGAMREAMLDRLADAVESHLDTRRLADLIENGAPTALPFVPPGAPS